MSGDSGEILVIKPLTKRKKTGELYTRRPEVEEQLPEAVRLTVNELAERLAIPKKGTSGYLYDETLVYLFREAHRRKDTEMENLIYDQLAVRVAIILRKNAYQASENDPEDFVNEIHIKLLKKIFDLDSDKGDFAQVRFGKFVSVLAKSDKKRIWMKRKSEPQIVEIDAPNEDGYDFDPPAGELNQVEVSTLRNALARIPEKTATAYVMHYIDGFQIESKDPDEPTVARHFGVSGRTIRNWFGHAVRMLTENNGEEE